MCHSSWEVRSRVRMHSWDQITDLSVTKGGQVMGHMLVTKVSKTTDLCGRTGSHQRVPQTQSTCQLPPPLPAHCPSICSLFQT